MPNSILIVEDEQAIRQMLDFTLTGDDYECSCVSDAAEAQTSIAEKVPDLILLDWMLPGISGIDFARRLKRDPNTSKIPIIMLTARSEEAEKVKGLDVGADDYITKPFSNNEMLARIRAVLRRSKGNAEEDILEVDGLQIDNNTHRAHTPETEIQLSPTEFKLLHYFISHPERVYSRSQLLDAVWGDNVYVEERTVDVHIRRLRKVLEPHGYADHIQTVRSIGYRFSKTR